MKRLSADDWHILKPLVEHLSIKKGTILFHEDEEAEDLFFIEKGELSVIKEGHTIAVLKKGVWAGEIAPLTQKKRTATVKARRDCALLKVSLTKLKEATKTNPALYHKIMADLSIMTAEKLAESSNTIVKSVKNKLKLASVRNEMGQFIVYFLIAFSTFFYIQKAASLAGIKMNITPILLLCLAAIVILFVKKSKLPLSAFGVTSKNWKRAVGDALVWTPFLLIFGFVYKWATIRFIPGFEDEPLFIINKKVHQFSPLLWTLFGLGYALFVPVQEFISRGFLQGALMQFLRGKSRYVLAIILSNLVFSALHLILSLEAALFAFLAGCFWGWLYVRNPTIIGVSVSHIIFGILAFFVVGPIGIG